MSWHNVKVLSTLHRLREPFQVCRWRLKALMIHLLQLESATAPSCLGVHVVDKFTMQSFNEQYRNIPSSTDVLSFPSDIKLDLGDVLICPEHILMDASELGCDPSAHLARVALHGFTHLLGYDHELDANHAVQMYQKELELLAQLTPSKLYTFQSMRQDAFNGLLPLTILN
eukprot:m.72170 g.72170  ORF g.72170 m.72170 type:complete len:171 (-) comp14242_c0_seq1:2687-3199(-)